MVQAFISFEDNRDSPDSAARGSWLIIAYAAVYIGIAVSQKLVVSSVHLLMIYRYLQLATLIRLIGSSQ